MPTLLQIVDTKTKERQLYYNSLFLEFFGNNTPEKREFYNNVLQ